MKSPLQCKRCGTVLTPVGICPVCAVKSVAPPPRRPNQFGQYELEESLVQRGGMGVVYKAFSPRTQRHVALKMLKNEILLSAEALERFRNEIRALAALDHPNILPIYEAGTVEGQPFFAMRWVQGGSLAEHLGDYTLAGPQPAGAAARAAASRKLAEFLAEVALAVHHPHKKGILHRDLKPNNILLDQEGHPYVADFGIAKFLDEAQVSTLTQCDIGSPPYMPPEPARQAAATWDIWSLGVILYELLTGALPFQAEDKPALLMKIRQEEPVRPTRLNPAVDRDLEIICLKCLQKEPTRRYASAKDLAEDLLRYARDEPIQARAPGSWERGWYYCRRRPWKTLAVLSLCGLGLLLGLWRVQFLHQRQLESAASLRKGLELLEQHQTPDGLAWLARALHEDPGNALAATRAAHSLLENDFLVPVTGLLPHDERRVNALAFSPDGSHLAAGTAGLEARLWDASTGQALSPPLPHPRLVSALAFSPDGRWLVSGSHRFVQLWNATNGVPSGSPLKPQDWVTFAAFGPEADRLLTVTKSGGIQAWDLATHIALGIPLSQQSSASAVSLDAVDRRVLTASSQGGIQAWDLGAPSTAMLSPEETNGVACTAFSPDGQRAVNVLTNGSVRLFDTHSGHALGGEWIWPDTVEVAFSAAHEQLAAGSTEGTVTMLNLQTGRAITNAEIRGAAVSKLLFITSRSLLVCGYENGLLRVLDAESGREAIPAVAHSAGVSALAWHKEKGLLAVGYKDGNARIWRLQQRCLPRTVVHQPGSIMGLALSPDGQQVLTGTEDGSVNLWDVPRGTRLKELPRHGSNVVDTVFSPDGRWLATASFDKTVRVYPTDSTNPGLKPLLLEHAGPVRRLAFCPGRPLLATAAYDGCVRLWELPSGQLLDCRQPTNLVRALAVSKNSELVAAASGRTIWVWRLQDKLQPWRQFEEPEEIRDVAFSPDGRLLASACWDGKARVREVDSWRLRAECLHGGRMFSVSFSPDGRCLLTASTAGTARVWDAESGLALTEPFPHSRELLAARFSPDQQGVFTAAADGMVRRWPLLVGWTQRTPAWWPDFIEGFVQKRVDESGSLGPAPARPPATWHSQPGLDARSLEGRLAAALEGATNAPPWGPF